MSRKFERYQDKAGEFRFRSEAGNGQVIAVVEAYERKKSALNGIESIRKYASEAKLDDQTVWPRPHWSGPLR